MIILRLFVLLALFQTARLNAVSYVIDQTELPSGGDGIKISWTGLAVGSFVNGGGVGTLSDPNFVFINQVGANGQFVAIDMTILTPGAPHYVGQFKNTGSGFSAFGDNPAGIVTAFNIASDGVSGSVTFGYFGGPHSTPDSSSAMGIFCLALIPIFIHKRHLSANRC